LKHFCKILHKRKRQALNFSSLQESSPKCLCIVQCLYGPPLHACNNLHALALAEAAATLSSSLATALEASHLSKLQRQVLQGQASGSCPIFQSLLLQLLQHEAAATADSTWAEAMQFDSTRNSSSSFHPSRAGLAPGVENRAMSSDPASALLDGYVAQLLQLLQAAAMGSQVRTFVQILYVLDPCTVLFFH
jgi:hypothetical protein